MNVDLPLDPRYYILGLVPEGAMDKKKAQLLQILLLVARKMITILWLKPLPPTLHQWKERLKTVYLMEKITAKLHCRMGLFLTLWAPVINHLKLPSSWVGGEWGEGIGERRKTNNLNFISFYVCVCVYILCPDWIGKHMQYTLMCE